MGSYKEDKVDTLEQVLYLEFMKIWLGTVSLKPILLLSQNKAFYHLFFSALVTSGRMTHLDKNQQFVVYAKNVKGFKFGRVISDHTFGSDRSLIVRLLTLQPTIPVPNFA